MDKLFITYFNVETGRPEAWPQVRWTTAEVVYDKHGEPFDPAAVL